MAGTTPPAPIYVDVDRDDLYEATGGFAQAVEDIAHHELGDGWDFTR